MKRRERAKRYGSEKQTIPLLMPNTRYEAFFRLLKAEGKDINKVVRDLIEEAYGKDLDKKERAIILSGDMQESA